MFIRFGLRDYQTSKSVIVAGTVASGKTHFISRLRECVSDAKEVDRSVVEAQKVAPPGSIIHWPIAEKVNDPDLSNVGAVVMLDKNWEDYSDNIVRRGRTIQYSKKGLEGVYQNWYAYFDARGIPILSVTSNDEDLRRVTAWLLRTLKLAIPL